MEGTMNTGYDQCILTVHEHSDGLALPPVKCLGSHQKLLVLKSIAEEPDPILS